MVPATVDLGGYWCRYLFNPSGAFDTNVVHFTFTPACAMERTARIRRRTSAPASGRIDRPRSVRHEDLTFESEGVRCTAWQWWPEGADAAPCVVLAYGYDGLRGQRPDADRIADARLVILPEAASNAIGSALGKPPCRDAQRFLTTVLMTDIVESTSTAIRLGDRRWRELLANHYAECRAQVDSRGGELVNTTGDGILATFDGPGCAVRAAIAIQAAARESGIALRAGVHTGECERLDGGLAGVAIHIASRICDLGTADEVITTGTVRDLVVGSMLEFEPRGQRELRGVPGEWSLFGASDPG
jgi:class 3 adenylate cyclase